MKTPAHYMSLPYPMEIIPDEGGFVAMIPDLPGCMSSGTTVEEALKGLEEAKELWVEGKLEENEAIPEPTAVEDYSGKFVLRIPKSLHHSLDYEARKQGISLNQYVLHVLSERHYLSSMQGAMETVLKRLAAGPSTPNAQHRAWSWEQSRFRTGLHFIILSHPEEDALENLGCLPAPPSGTRMVFQLPEVAPKNFLCNVQPSRKIGGYK